MNIKDLLAQNSPGRNQKCLCGSRLKFKNCCSEFFLKVEPNTASQFLQEGDFSKALIFSRAFFSYYSLLNKSHTQAIAKKLKTEDFPLFRVDIDALDESLQQIFFCYKKNNIENDWPATLLSLLENCDSPRIKELILTKLAEWHYYFQNDKKRAFEVISGISPETSLSPMLIGLHLDLSPIDFPFKVKITLIDRILNFSTSKDFSLHISIVKGISYCLINDEKSGIEIIKGAIDKYKSEVLPENRDPFFLAKALLVFSQFTSTDEFIQESIDLFRSLLKNGVLINDFKAEAYLNLGNALHFSKDFDGAIEAFQISYKLVPYELCQIFIAQSHLAKKEVDQARITLNKVLCQNLTPPNRADFAVGWAHLALLSKNKDDICSAKTQLKLTDYSEPNFVSFKNKLLIDILELNPLENSSFWEKAIDFVNKYVSLKPNLFGIGIDLNSVLREIKTTFSLSGEKAHEEEETRKIEKKSF